MPDLKYGALQEATEPPQIGARLGCFLEGHQGRLLIEGTRLYPPICYWVAYRYGERQITLKSFFAESDYAHYTSQLLEHYPEQIDQPGHPHGGMVFLPDLNAIVWEFPFDPAMPGLHHCADGTWVGSALDLPQGTALIPQLVDYTPEVGTILAYRIPRRKGVLAYGKAAPRDNSGLQFLIMDRLWRSPAREAGVLRVARPLAYRPEAGLLLQSAVPGRPIPGHRNRAVFLHLAQSAAAMLAAVHGTDIPFGSTRTIESYIQRLGDTLEDLEFTAPTLYPTVRHYIQQLQVRANRTKPSPLVPSHGDYKYDQLLYARGRFSLIDFEMFCQSEPALDLGVFCAYLPASDPDDWRDGTATEILRSAFLTSYEQHRGQAIDWDRLALYESAALTLRGLSYVWRQTADWELRASAMVDLAFERLVNPDPRRSLHALACA